MDRENGLLSYPNTFYKEQVITKFDNTAIFIGTSGRYNTPALKLWHSNQRTAYTFSILNVHFWSFMVWYMDKNRPLPPGDAFDEFRERDFQRRKAEGFPSPLYPSFVPTPEATTEQQAERDQYWEERFTTNQNGETQRHFWERDSSLKVDKSQHN